MQKLCKVLIADGLAEEGLNLLKQNNSIELMYFDAVDRKKLKELIGQVDILVVRSRTQVDKDLLDSATSLKIALRAGIGLDNIDVATATQRAIVVMNAPTGNIVTTAEHTLALLFAATRHVPQADAMMRQGKWEKKKFQGNELRNKTLGLVGLGNIGKAVAERARGLNMKVIAHDPYLSAEAAARYNVELVSFETCLAQADYITIHVPLTDSTRHLIGTDAFAKMKDGAYLINCARGGIVDEAALMKALDAGKLSGAALDVFEQEPLPPDSPLLKRTDMVITPHLGASTDEAQVQVSLEVAEQINQYLQNGVLKNAINVPNVTLEQLEVMKPYVNLCERLGAFLGNLAPKDKIEKVRIHYEGSVINYKHEILTLSVIKGFLSPLLSTPVNFVNARNLLRERGIRVEESFDEECADYSSLVRVSIEGSEKLTLSGTLFGKGEPRIVAFDNFALDAIPEGYLLVTRNVDQPGVIGAMGGLIGQSGINIGRMHLGRDVAKSQAIAIINVDSAASNELLDKIRSVKGMLAVKQIRL